MSYAAHQQAAGDVVARCAIVTLSDTRTPETDESGRQIRELLEAVGHQVSRQVLIPDDAAGFSNLLDELLADATADVILTTGGTGISGRDQAVEVVEAVLDQPLPGFGELFRMLSWEQVGSGAMLSRAAGGVADGKLLFAMPGSVKAVKLAMERLIVPELKHLLRELRK